MKKSIFIILLSTLILTGCSSQKFSQDQLFENRVKCDNLKNKIKEEYEVITNGMYQTRLDEVFFSPKRNSCLYVLVHNYGENSKLSSSYHLFDYFTNAYIDNCNYGKNEKDNYRVIEFQETLKELKGE